MVDRFRDLAIAKKLMVSMLLTTGLALGPVTAGFTFHQIGQFRRSVNARVTSLALSLGANSAGALAFQDEDAAARVVRSVEGQPYVVIACLYVPEGPLLAAYQRDAATACPPNVAAFGAVGDNPLHYLSTVDYEGDSVGSVALVADQEELWVNLGYTVTTAVALLTAALGAAWALAFLLRRWIAEPLLQLVAVAKKVTKRRDYSIRAVPTSEDEVGLLGRTFNNMLDQLEADAEDRTSATQNLKDARDKAEAASLAKSSFLATMSHEIRTPMNGITGMITLLLTTPLNPEQRQYASIVQRSTDSLLQIINDVLDFSRIEAGKVVLEDGHIDLEQVILDVVDLMHPKAREKNIDLLTLYPPGLSRRFFGDAGRLRQVLLNLTGNAVKFTESGHVLIKVDRDQTGGDRSLVHVSVEDSGAGIPEHLREGLFEEFARGDNSTTRTEGGTGLGLAISKRFIELMGGTIRVHDSPGGGARFVFSVPLRVDTPASTDETTNGLRHLRVLALSPQDQSRAVLVGQLGPWVCKLDLATTGDEALVALKAAAARQVPYHVLVADQRPHTDVEELASHVKADPRLEQTLLMALTSTQDSEHERRFRKAGFSAHLVKPVTASTMLDALSVVWEAHSEGRDCQMVTKGLFAARGESTDGRQSIDTSDTQYRVLVAEDNGVNQEVATKLVKFLGGCADVAPNGRDAVRMAGAQAYDLILMDCQMPVLDGYQATAEIRRLEGVSQHVPIVAMTANAMSGDKERCIAAGMDDYVMKPVKLDRLSEVIGRWLRRDATGVSSVDAGTRSGDGGDDVRRVAPPAQAAPEAALSDTPSDSTISEVALEQTIELDSGGKLLRRLVDLYLRETPAILDELHSAVHACDPDRAARAAHALKSASLNVGAEGVAAVCRELETLKHKGSFEGAESLAYRLDQAFPRVRAALEALVLKHPGRSRNSVRLATRP